MFATLPHDAEAAIDWPWSRFEPYYTDLADRPLSQANLETWLQDWSRLSAFVSEVGARLGLTFDRNTTDADSERLYFTYLETLSPAIEAAENRLQRKLLDSGFQPDGLALQLRGMHAHVALFRDENLPLMTEEEKLGAQYDKLVGAMTVEWEGQELPLAQLRPIFQDADRARRERAWWLMHERRLADRENINGLWQGMLALRRRIAANADQPDYRAYTWQSLLRFDYSPANCDEFRHAIETRVVPAATRIYEKHRQRLGLTSLRPWDLTDGSWGRPSPTGEHPPLKPYHTADELLAISGRIFDHVDPQLAAYFHTMLNEGLLDVENRKGKAPGGYCTYFATARRPFIFMNAVGLHDDVQTMLHEAGHAFHGFEKQGLPLFHQLSTPMEFNEVAAMGMELLAAPFLAVEQGGFYSQADAARARLEHLESLILFWPYMAVVDAFQHWAYTHPDAAMDTEQCDAAWQRLWGRFIPGVDWSGLEAELVTGWQRRLHIFRVPFYYVEYGLAQLGAVQVWANALANPAQALAHYRRALALGGTATLPDLFATAGVRFAFDADTLGKAVALTEGEIEKLETAT